MTEKTSDPVIVKYGSLEFVYPSADFTDPDIPKGVVSPGQYSMYTGCPRSYYYAYVLGEPRSFGLASSKGKVLHKGVELALIHKRDTGKTMQYAELLQAMSDKWDKEAEYIEDWGDTNKGEMKDAIQRNFHTYYEIALPRINPIKIESTFAKKIGSVPVRGVIDLVEEGVKKNLTVEDDVEDGEFPKENIIVDLKTTTKMWAPQMIRYHPQFTIYSIVENTEQVRIDFLIEQKRGIKYERVETERKAIDKRTIVEDLEEMVYNVKKGFFPRCDPTHWKCTPKWCSFYGKCRGGKS